MISSTPSIVERSAQGETAKAVGGGTGSGEAMNRHVAAAAASTDMPAGRSANAAPKNEEGTAAIDATGNTQLIARMSKLYRCYGEQSQTEGAILDAMIFQVMTMDRDRLPPGSPGHHATLAKLMEIHDRALSRTNARDAAATPKVGTKGKQVIP